MGNLRDWTGIPGAQYPILQSKIPTKLSWNHQRIYRDTKGKYYHRDPLHSEVEVYDKRGNHIGVMTPEGDLHTKKGQDKTKTLKGII